MSTQPVTVDAVRPVTDRAGVFDHVVLGGYMLEHQIGTGGYGEVWKAIGPGGFAKAVKVLFGNLDGVRAEAELKSLQRMRDLRHPFLLSIERVDIQNGRVFVVTELADCSLDDRFEKCRQDGQAGIPRDELLGYLRDAADALDYMANDQGLQHLDVKPENLLLQGSHVKVGDFGLTRDISRSGVTAMGGFTPLYTPPEVFEGKPGRNSDQYSLAIVYQLMLTGTAPFSGRTPAQLAAQHLRSRPDLTPLEPAERPIVARALSKTASARFPSCREFVEALASCKVTGRTSDRSWSSHSQPVGEASKTRVVASSSHDTTSEEPAQPSAPVSVSEPAADAAQDRPTIFIGLGGLGGSVLCSLHESLRDSSSFDNLSFLYIDSDRASVSAARYHNGVDLLEGNQTLLVPLKTAAEYRRSSHLDWLSRRWLFNIPRSGQVEGIRPLGRLAFLDHYQVLRDRVTELLKTVSSADASGSEPSATSEVVIVAGINGGFGSGAVLDLAYLVRDVLAEVRIDGCQITGYLLHGTGLSPQGQQLQDANAYACLTEMKYYGTQGLGYDCSVSASDGIQDVSAFDDCYVIHLGESLSSQAFSTTTADVANFLCASVSGEESRWLRDWRQLPSQSEDGLQAGPESQTCRTVGFARIDDGTMQFAAQMCHAVTVEWTDPEYNGRRELTPTATAKLDEALKRMTPTAKLLREHVGKVATGKQEELRTEFVAALDVNNSTDADSLATFLERLNSEGNLSGPLGAVFRTIAHGLAKQVAARSESTLQLTESVCLSRAGIEAVGGHLLQRLETFRNDVAAFRSEAESQLQNLLLEAAEAKPEPQSLMKLCRCWSLVVLTRALDDAAEQLTTSMAGLIFQATKRRSNEMLQLRMHFAGIAGIEDSPESEADSDDDELACEYQDLEEASAESSEPADERRQIPEALVRLLGDQLLNASDRTVTDCMNSGGAVLAASMMIQRSVEMVTSALTPEPEAADQATLQFPVNAQPILSGVGGRHRVLAATPGKLPEKWKTSLTQTFGDCIAECPGASRLTVWCEVEGILLDNVQQFLRRSNAQVKDVASRVQTRRDIEWSSLWG